MCTNGDIRLAGSKSNDEGTVELCFHSRWGTICDDSWDNTDAEVVCGQLNLPVSG